MATSKGSTAAAVDDDYNDDPTGTITEAAAPAMSFAEFSEIVDRLKGMPLDQVLVHGEPDWRPDMGREGLFQQRLYFFTPREVMPITAFTYRSKDDPLEPGKRYQIKLVCGGIRRGSTSFQPDFELEPVGG